MPPPPTECPRCESEQNFIPKLRATVHGWQEEYIRCSVCHWEGVLRPTTPAIEAVRIKLRGYTRRARDETERHGQPQVSTVDGQRRLGADYLRLERELQQQIRDHGGSTAPNPHAA